MAKSNLKLFTLLTSVRLEKETSGILRPGEHSKGDEVEIDELYGRGLVSNLMAVVGKVEPEPEPADIEPLSDGFSQEEVDRLVKVETDKFFDLQSKHDALSVDNGKLKEEVDRLNSEIEEVTQPPASHEPIASGNDAAKPTPK